MCHRSREDTFIYGFAIGLSPDRPWQVSIMPEDIHHLAHFLLSFALLDSFGDTVAQVTFHQQQRHLLERGLHACDLRQNINTVLFLFNHALQATCLTLYSTQARQNLTLIATVGCHCLAILSTHRAMKMHRME